MTLSVAAISRWDADAVRAVADAASVRAEALMGAADGLAVLPGFGSWQGDWVRGGSFTIPREPDTVRARLELAPSGG